MSELIPRVIGYEDSAGGYSIRLVRVQSYGRAVDDHQIEWVGAFDGAVFKTFRKDRIRFIRDPRDVEVVFRDKSGML